MRLWKLSVIVTAIIFGAFLRRCLFISPLTTATKHRLLFIWDLPSRSSSSFASAGSSPAEASSRSSSSAPSSSSAAGSPVRRRARSTGHLSFMLSELMQMFQSLTEAEIKSVIDKLVSRKQIFTGGQTERRPRRAHGHSQTKARRQCGIREEQLTVSDLGLGYLSEETISFRYCSGSCRRQRRNYDLIMKQWAGRGVSRRDRAPCCRPVEYEEDTVVLDNQNKYQTLHEYSAQKCGCV